MSTSLKINRLESVGISVQGTICSTSAEKSATDTANGEKRPIDPEPPHQTDDNADSFSNALLNESFDSISDIQRSFSSTADERETFSLSDPVSSPTLPKSGDFNLVNIAIPKLKPSYDDEYSSGEVSPVKIICKLNRCSDSPPVFQPTKSKQERIPYHMRRPSSVTAVSYVAPDTPVHWAHPGSYHTPPITSNPYFVIRLASKQLAALKYTLPCLNGVDLCPVNVNEYHGHIRHYQDVFVSQNSRDIIIGSRRVETAICAFGGLVPNTHPLQQHRQRMSIFRDKNDTSSKTREHYEQVLPSRYSISDRRISWDIEEHPPIPNSDVIKAEDSISVNCDDEEKKSPTERTSKRTRYDDSPSFFGDTFSSSNSRYRCKLCGQPKHNHSCPYRPSLQRSIGVMVYPAANSYTAAEPGRIAPSLTEMNNDVLYDSDNSYHLNTHEAPSAEMLATPEVPRVATTTTAPIFHSPESALTYPSDDSITKRSHEMMNTMTSPFVASVTLHPEQFRAVTPTVKNDCAFSYPPIPLAFMERKRLSDTLFLLARQIPHMTEETALVLHQARVQDEWDQGTAELLTQVVIGLFCVEGDARLDGLQRYLLSLGISS